MLIYDAHNHPDWHGHDLNKFLANMDEMGIRKTWLLSHECGEDEYSRHYWNVTPGKLLGEDHGPIPFSRVLSYVERAPERFIPGYCPDPRTPDACGKLYAANQIYGARVCGELKVRMTYDSPDAIRLFQLAGELGMPVTFHLQYDLRQDWREPRTEWWGGDIDAIERALQKCPKTIFCGHAPGFWIHISGDDLYAKTNYPPLVDGRLKVQPGGRLLELLRKYDNLYCDLSAGSGCMALRRDPEFALGFFQEFQDRLLYARDYFDNQHQEFINSLNLSQDILSKVYAGNAIRLVP